MHVYRCSISAALVVHLGLHTVSAHDVDVLTGLQVFRIDFSPVQLMCCERDSAVVVMSRAGRDVVGSISGGDDSTYRQDASTAAADLL